MRSKKYKEAVKQIDKTKSYPIDEAIKLVKSTSLTKFDATVEVHIRLGIDPKKGDQMVRANVTLPYGTGKTKRIAAFCENEKVAQGADVIGNEDLIKNIVSSGKIDFDIAVATPEMMVKLARAAKVLGPRGLMPSPKAGTVVPEDKLAEVINEIKKGKINFKNDDTGNIHQALGKVSWDDKKIKKNYEVFVEAVMRAKPGTVKGAYIKNISLASSMGPGVKVNL